jgi:hypothetical protein
MKFNLRIIIYNDSESVWKEAAVAICQEGLRKSMKTLNRMTCVRAEI